MAGSLNYFQISVKLKEQINSVISQLSPIQDQFQDIIKNMPQPAVVGGTSPFVGPNGSDVENFQHYQVISICKQIQFLEGQLPQNLPLSGVMFPKGYVLGMQKQMVQLQKGIATLQKDVTTLQGKTLVNGSLKSQISILQERLGMFYHQITLLMDQLFKQVSKTE